MRARTLVAVFFVISIFSFGIPVHAAVLDSHTSGIAGVVGGEDSNFQITDSNYLNIGLHSTEVIKLRIESVPHIITMMLEPASASATSTHITITGLMASTTYYKYEDSYHTLALILTDENGAYAYTQDISKSHLIFIQPKKSTKFIRNDALGGDCASLGTWDPATLTCTLTTDLTETTQIDSDGITLDGGGHTTTGSDTGNGIYIDGKSNVTIKNLTIKNFSYGIFLNASSQDVIAHNSIFNAQTAVISFDSSSNTFDTNTFQDDSRAFMFFNSINTVVRGNTVTNSNSGEGAYFFNVHNSTVVQNTFSHLDRALFLFDSSDDNDIHDNTMSDMNWALSLFDSTGNKIYNNTFSSTNQALSLYGLSDNNEIYHNNFINNGKNAIDYSNTVSNTFSLPKPVGGNYFDVFDNPVEGCVDANLDGMCDAPYVFNRYFNVGQDTLPWTTSDGWKNPPAPKVSNVLFLPGIEGSRLYYRDMIGGVIGIEHQVWEPDYHTDIPYLAMNTNGTSKYQLYTKDIVDMLQAHNPYWNTIAGIFGTNNLESYSGFEHFMDGLIADGTVKEWRAYPYDWRYDVRDIVNNGTLVETSGSSVQRVYLADVLRAMAPSSPSHKVTIVGHSNGGLLAKALALSLGADASKYIDRIIMVGTPQWGTPSSIGAMLHGDGGTQGFGIITNGSDIRAAAETMPGTYGLLPTSAYFSHISDPVVTFNTGGMLSSNFAINFGAALTSFTALANFITDSAGLDATAGGAQDLRTPLALSSALVDKATATHSALDSWTPPAGITVTAIAGWGQDTPKALAYSTVSKVVCTAGGAFTASSVCADTPSLQHTPVLTQDGDDTVVSPSAFGDIGERFYFNADAFRSDGHGNIVHQNLMSAVSIENTIKNLLININQSNEEYIVTNRPPSSRNPITIRISSHSPINLVIMDASGNQSGVLPMPGTDFAGVKRDIPGSSVQVVDDEQYVSVPQSGTYQVVASGYAAGSATLNVDTMNNGVVTATTIFANVPTTPSSTATFSVVNGMPTAPAIDTNGDGVTDFTAVSSSVGTDPLVYVRYMRTVVKAMTLSKDMKHDLDEKLGEIEQQLVTAQKATDDYKKNDKEKGKEKEKKDKEREKEKKDNNDKILRQLTTLWDYVGKKSQRGIPATTVEIILGMINQLKTLL